MPSLLTFDRPAIGDPVPDVIGRTDEETPMSLADLKGRALLVFLLGGMEYPKPLLTSIVVEQDTIFALNVSPIIVSVLSEETLAAWRYQPLDLPFLLLSDFSGDIHRSLGYCLPQSSPVAFLVTADGRIDAWLPPLPPDGLISEALSRFHRGSMPLSR